MLYCHTYRLVDKVPYEHPLIVITSRHMELPSRETQVCTYINSLIPKSKYSLIPKSKYSFIHKSKYSHIPKSRHSLIPKSKYSHIHKSKYNHIPKSRHSLVLKSKPSQRKGYSHN